MADFNNAGVIFINDRRILVVKPIDRAGYIVPGGAIESGEEPIEAAIREIREELGIVLEPTELKDMGTFTSNAIGFDDGRKVNMHLFLSDRWKEATVERDGEIEDEKWIDSVSAETVPIGNVLKEYIIPRLTKDRLIN